jgi:hypothetical protein
VKEIIGMKEDFLRDGCVVIEDFVPHEIVVRIRLELLGLIQLLVTSNTLDGFADLDFSDDGVLDEAFLRLREVDPRLTSRIYAAAKKLPSVARFVTSDAHLEVAQHLIGTKKVAFSDRGWGLRIDYPNDVKHATPLHQDYHTQLGSINGIVIWVPITDVSLDMGPLVFYPNSDSLGIQRVKKVDNGSLSTDLEIDFEPADLERFSGVQPEVKAGTAVIINYLLLHKSGKNLSQKCRWSILSRWFDFENPAAIERGWHGGVQEGFKFEEVHPEFRS